MKFLYKKVVIVSMGLFLFSIVFYLTYKISGNRPHSGNSIIGRTINSDQIISVGRNSKISFDNKESILLIISPTCPHCKKIIGILNQDNIQRSINIFPVFKEKTPLDVIENFIEMEKIKIPLYRSKNSTLVDSIRYVPAFVYVKGSLIRNVIVGGLDDKNAIDKLIESLLKEKWQSKKLSRSQSACSS